ncbi:PREDICTED: gap junction delta-3 protein [Condylura cristata]|uniref:gap junction delta-3 protein n=1 Tax=Condylura cristata TaxID=143302 RepID=UPI0003346B3D|nr:PREDICTED: gap junction delta-3 protein [Condylura cristata]
MGEWAFLGSLLDAVQLQSPLVGRLWLVVMLIFRILVLATVGGAVFEDEQEEFVCNTLQPGCRQTCYDRAFPVSHYRFWLFHILLLSAPPVLFVIYSMHRASEVRCVRVMGSDSPCTGGPILGQQQPLWTLPANLRMDPTVFQIYSSSKYALSTCPVPGWISVTKALA